MFLDRLKLKLNLLKAAYRSQKKIIMSGGAGGKLDPTRLQVADISKTYNCVLVKLIRKRLRKEKIYKGIKVVFSDELPNRDSLILTDGANFKRSAYGTISYLPAAFGGVSASVVIRDLIG